MKQILKAGVILMACFGLNAAAQDWYHDRDARFQGDPMAGPAIRTCKVGSGPHQ